MGTATCGRGHSRALCRALDEGLNLRAEHVERELRQHPAPIVQDAPIGVMPIVIGLGLLVLWLFLFRPFEP